MDFRISGTVVRGDGYGHKLGFPTANIDAQTTEIVPGVYGGKVQIGRKIYRAAIVINEAGKTEAHMFGFRGDAYSKEITLRIQKYIRKYKLFKTEIELITQIKKDIKQC